MLFQHAGLRSSWPILLFLPWVLVGLGFLLKAIRDKRPGRSASAHG
jgi:hypothetical protein